MDRLRPRFSLSHHPARRRRGVIKTSTPEKLAIPLLKGLPKARASSLAARAPTDHLRPASNAHRLSRTRTESNETRRWGPR